MNGLMDINILNTIDNSLEKIQNNFLSTTLGKIVDNSIDFGIKSIFPNFIENEVIDVKNSILEYGIKDLLDSKMDSAIKFGKDVIGIFNGNFESISQIENALKKGGVVDNISSILDFGINFAKEFGLLNKDIASGLLKGKEIIIENVDKSIQDNMKEQIKSLEKINNYCEKWEKALDERDINELKKNSKNLEKTMEKIVPLENVIKKARQIENYQNLLENNDYNFDISVDSKELLKIL